MQSHRNRFYTHTQNTGHCHCAPGENRSHSNTFSRAVLIQYSHVCRRRHCVIRSAHLRWPAIYIGSYPGQRSTLTIITSHYQCYTVIERVTMSRLTLMLLFCILAISWSIVSGLGDDFSTRRPDAQDGSQDPQPDDGDDNDEGDDDNDEDGEDDDEPELIITSVETKPYLMASDDSGFEGIIPDLLKAICDAGHMSCDYKIVTAVDGEYGGRDAKGEWTGMIGEVEKGEGVDFAAAPIAITDERLTAVNFSVPFEDNALTVVVHEGDDIDSLASLLVKNITIGGVDGGASLNTLRNQREAPYTTLWSAVDSKSDSRVASSKEGIERVLQGNYAFICEASVARFYVERHCTLRRIKETFLPGKGNAFAFPKHDDAGLEDDVNTAINSLKGQGKIAEIYSKWMDATCGATGLTSLKMVPLILMAAFFVVM